ncbi:glycosyltransferase [Polaribacter pectinis]|uniref:Glycosyltransferase n=1 Tax=Polaribacter pectinis TaxID=2738844 RepID=A0A7G9L6W5_9FLAO|nr:glycosyltransferase [Polaribacter pectinis]QNM84364.1 glycosyltransferase [Polaribacter pectinis]
MNKIIVSVSNDLSTDQRVAKVCNTLVNGGYEILLIGRKLSDSKEIHRNYKTKRIKLLFNNSFLFYAEYNFRLFFLMLFLKKDILLSNDLDTLLPNYLVSRFQGKKLVYDSHELFSEIPELVERPFVKKCWTSLEKWLLPKLKNTYTVCNSIAEYYNERYQTNFKTIVNLPTQKQVEKGTLPFETADKKIILYQGAINVGRGLELMIETMQFLPNHVFVIIGSGDIICQLKEQVVNKKLNDRIFFMGKITPNELHKITPLADLGISIEEDLGLNYRFALPNKIFDYIQAEVPVLVSNLPEMKKVVQQYKVGEIVLNRMPEKLAKQIIGLTEKDFSAALKKAKTSLIWENQEEELLEIFRSCN